MARSFDLDVEKCASCGGRLKLHAVVTEPAGVARLLRHLGEPTEAPSLSPARGPPFYQSRVFRRRPQLPAPQMELFAQ